MKLATTTHDFDRYTASYFERVKYIASAGFKYIDFGFSASNRNDGVFSPVYKEFCASLRKETEDLGVRFVQAHAPMGKPLLEDGSHETFVADNIRCIECCSLLGIDRIVVHSGYLPGISKEECFERNRVFFNELLPEAERRGVYILVENFNKMHVEGTYWIDNAPDLLGLIEFVDHPLFQAVWDAGHANMQEMPQDEALSLLGNHVKALHIQDNGGKKDSHTAPFFGSLSLDSLMHGLLSIGYDGYFTFEATNFFLPGAKRRPYEKDTRLLEPPLGLMLKAEELLYETGKTILTSYDCFEE